MIVYFSGTGNSRYAAEFLAHQLREELVDAGRRIKSHNMEALHSERPWIFVAPTYAWQMPHIFEDYLRSIPLEGSKEAYFILTCGSEIGDAGSYAKVLCEDKGLEYRGIQAVIMPENYIAMFDTPDAESCAAMLQQAKPVLRTCGELISDGCPFPERKIGIKDRKRSGIVNKSFYRMFVKAKDFYATEKCIGCGACVEACPLNNIHLEGERPVWGEQCTHCMACICGCPIEAIEYGKISRGKVRYLCPPYEA